MKPLLFLLSLIGSAYAADLVTHAPGDGKAAFTFDKTAWSTDEATRKLPIGVFDSGIGGLTVMEAILKLDAFHNDRWLRERMACRTSETSASSTPAARRTCLTATTLRPDAPITCVS